MALSPAFLDELRARTPMAALVGRRVKLSKSGRNWKGCCPFHNEKSPSFYVYEDGFHCFGCGAHGDAVSFVMQSQGAAFIEAVEALAGEAGLEVPKPSPRAAEAERQRLDLNGVLDAAQAAFVRRLHAPEGAAGLAYLRGRGLSDDTISRFGLGWSGDGRGGLTAELARSGVNAALMLEAGLMRAAEEGEAPREAYFNRVMFPIRDRRGRLVSFGGRTLGDAKPKYVNGAETALFSKRRQLYALDLARDAARGGAAVVAVEGYMDVIALHQAGFGGAVAPLGTALAEEQLEELWRLSPAPVLCFDGDAAGARAASRTAELALPLLTPERTLRLAALPEGQDPDSLVRSGGPGAFQSVLDRARPLAEALFDMLREGGVGDAPEARAAFLARLDAAAGRIADRNLSREYRTTLRDRFYEVDRQRRDQRKGQRGGAGAARPTARPPRAAASADASEDATRREQARCLCAIIFRHPALLRDLEEAFAGLALPPPLDGLRDAVLHWAEEAELDSAALLTHLRSSRWADDAARVLSADPLPLPACASPEAMPAEAEEGWWHIFGLMRRAQLQEDFEAACREYAAQPDEAALQRVNALHHALEALSAPGSDDPEPG